MKHKTRLTKQKKAVLDVLKKSDKLLSAQELYDSVITIFPNMSLGTVYRNLDSLTNQALVIKIIFPDSVARFEIADYTTPHHHLICLQCGYSVRIPWCPMSEQITDYINKQLFKPQFHRFDVFGLCQKCKENKQQ